MNKPEIRSLTGVRGIAAVVITAYHLAYLMEPTQIAGYVFPGYLAVDLFFALSGFVLALNYARKLGLRPSYAEYRGFLVNRFARIYPVYIVLTAVKVAAYSLSGKKVYAASTLIANILLIQFWGLGSLHYPLGITVFGSSWSISTEVLAYVLFPLILAVGCARSRQTVAVGAIVCILALELVALRAPGVRGVLDSNDGSTAYPVLRCLAGFTGGVIAWRVSVESKVIQQAGLWFDAVLVAALAVLLAMPGSDLFTVLLFPVLIIRLLVAKSPLTVIAASPLAVFFGDISYSLYLIQSSTTALLQAPLTGMLAGHAIPDPRFAASTLLFAFDVLAAVLLYNGIEKPARRMIRGMQALRRDRASGRAIPQIAPSSR